LKQWMMKYLQERLMKKGFYGVCQYSCRIELFYFSTKFIFNSFKSPIQSKLARCACCPVDVQWKENRFPLNIHREKGKFFILE
ncbi:TPA: hypothetical protein ACN7HJ_005318, partial [Klebsiella pneumoniae]